MIRQLCFFARIGVLVFALSTAGVSFGACLTLIKGPIAVDVHSCNAIDPNTSFNLQEDRFKQIRELDAKSRAAFFSSYRGVMMRGKVVNSQAVRTGLSDDKGALFGENVFLFVPPGKGSCEGAIGYRYSGQLNEVCCDGAAEAPCLLNSSYIFTELKPLGATAKQAGNQARQKAEKSENYKQAEDALAKKKFAIAAKHFEAARAKDELDILGLFKLAAAYRRLDACPKAIPPLETIHEKYLRKQTWADEEPTIRKSNFLLARCYAKLNRPGDSVLLLNSYLLEPRKYKAELTQSLNNPDFGYIHTSKEYRLYKADAEKKLRALK